MTIERGNKLIGTFMGDTTKLQLEHDLSMVEVPRTEWHYDNSWTWLMPVGDKMESLILEGNWGLHPQFFSDEMHSYDRFREACGDRNIHEAFDAAIGFIKAVECQDPEVLKLAKF